MRILEKISVPTGYIVVAEGSKGKLEFLSIGDYGKHVNLNKDQIVADDTPLMPLTDKWVITISTQYGCDMACKFCDVPRVGKGTNCTMNDLQQQVLNGLKMFPEVKYSNRLNIHYARMGEPTFNPNVLDHAKWMKDHIDPEYNVHPVLTSMMPKNNEWLKTAIHTWMRIKNRVYNGNAGLQLSINSTDEKERNWMFSGKALSLLEISRIMEGIVPIGRKITLNFPVCDWKIDPDVLLRYFDTERFIIKLTPMHKTKMAEHFDFKTKGDYTSPEPYKQIEFDLKSVGYEVLVFIASEDEDIGMITCGNAVLASEKSGKNPRLRNGKINFIGESPIGKTPFKKWNNQPDKYHVDLRETNIQF